MIVRNNIAQYMIGALLLAGSPATAEVSRSIRIEGRETTTITRRTVELADIADVRSPNIGDDEAIIALKKIVIADAPQPGQTVSLAGSQIVEKLRAAGVDFATVGYTLPRNISIKRAGRKITKEEVEQVIRARIRGNEAQTEIRDIAFPIVTVPTGELTIECNSLDPIGSNRRRFQMIARGEGEPVRFEARVSTQRWSEVPVLTRVVNKGEVLTSGDIGMARVNFDRVPEGALVDPNIAVGRESTRTLNRGEVLRGDTLVVPAVIKSGDKVVIRYFSGFLEATATGVAMESAPAGAPIKVRNDISKKVVSGKAKEDGIVEVH
jgi:flagella basal body P-ring formation protein FlgA